MTLMSSSCTRLSQQIGTVSCMWTLTERSPDIHLRQWQTDRHLETHLISLCVVEPSQNMHNDIKMAVFPDSAGFPFLPIAFLQLVLSITWVDTIRLKSADTESCEVFLGLPTRTVPSTFNCIQPITQSTLSFSFTCPYHPVYFFSSIYCLYTHVSSKFFTRLFVTEDGSHIHLTILISTLFIPMSLVGPHGPCLQQATSDTCCVHLHNIMENNQMSNISNHFIKYRKINSVSDPLSDH